jgi:transcriptional regulator with XRE-family HTH domain
MDPTTLAQQCGASLKQIRDEANMTQADLGVAVAPLLGRVTYTQTAVGKWEREGNMQLDVMVACEAVLEVPAGEILRRAGYLAVDASTVEDVIRSAADIPRDGREALVALVRQLSQVQAERPRP